MSRTWLKPLSVGLFVVIGLLLAVVPAAAQTPLGAGPDNPMAPPADWVSIQPGETRFYGFHVGKPVLKEGEDTESAVLSSLKDIEVKLQTVAHKGLHVEIWSQEEVNKWADEVKFDPVGKCTTSCGCKPEDEVQKMNWRGQFEPGDYFAVLKNDRGAATTYYKLSISGDLVSFPFKMAEEVAPAAAAQPAAAPEAVAAAKAVPAMGTTPGMAMAVSGDWTELPSGDHWYKFNYIADTGPKHDQDPPKIEILLNVDKPVDNARFTVWTQEEVDKLIAEGEDILGEDESKGTCVGCGSDNEDLKGDYSWSGSFLKSGTYYVRVEHTPCRCQPAYYQLQVTGKSVSF